MLPKLIIFLRRIFSFHDHDQTGDCSRACARCGRETHDAADCYAKTAVDGRSLEGNIVMYSTQHTSPQTALL